MLASSPIKYGMLHKEDLSVLMLQYWFDESVATQVC